MVLVVGAVELDGGGSREIEDKEEEAKDIKNWTGRSEEGNKQKRRTGRTDNYGLLSTASHCAKCFSNPYNSPMKLVLVLPLFY